MTVPTQLSINFEKYGTYARVGALADFLELLALMNLRFPFGDVEDYISDLGFTARRPIHHFTRIETGLSEDYPEESETWIDAVRTTLLERMDLLGEQYPFDIVRSALTWVGDGQPKEYGYLSLLATTLIHHHGWECPVNPRDVFESTVANCLRSRGLPTAIFGYANQAKRGSFPQALQEVGSSLGLQTATNPIPRHIYANDSGVDTIAVLPICDRRSGKIIFLGQVTCAASDNWENKLSSPKPSRWKQYLNESLTPRAFLAIPHHVDDRQMHHLSSSDIGFVLDRIRLTSMHPGPSGDELSLIETITSLPTK